MRTHPPAHAPSLVVDLFAGAGGASLGLEAGLGTHVHIAVNHWPAAIAVHAANHPRTRHIRANVWEVDPRTATQGLPVRFLWGSPDCTTWSRARGGPPNRSQDKKLRALPYVFLRWIRTVKPDVVALENVHEFQDWGPIRRDTGRPCPERKGQSFRRFIHRIQREGYEVEFRSLQACNFGSPTTRNRLFMIARCDGRPIRWPEQTHGPGRLPYHTTAECIDFSLPCPSIFASREEIRREYGLNAIRPLSKATLLRIAKGLKRYVLDDPQCFVVRPGHASEKAGSGMTMRGQHLDRPLSTVTRRCDYPLVSLDISQCDDTSFANPAEDPLHPSLGDNHTMTAPYLTLCNHAGDDDRSRNVDAPMRTLTASRDAHALIVPWLVQANTGMVGHDARHPLSTIVGAGSTQQLAEALLVRRKQPFRAAEIEAFLLKYQGTAHSWALDSPAPTLTAKPRLSLVTVAGKDYQIVDIGLRMLTPRELARCQGFPESYQLDVPIEEEVEAAKTRPARIRKSEQIKLIGNSVCPQVAEAVVRANAN